MKYLAVFLLLAGCLSCERKWTEEDRKQFIGGCMATAVADTMIGNRLAKDYCDCLVQEIERKFPNANDVKYIRFDSSTRQIGSQCLSKIRAAKMDSLQ